ncbi:MAG: hypothetical protein WBX01_07850 [Nitrososphaeraceae archaeon]
MIPILVPDSGVSLEGYNMNPSGDISLPNGDMTSILLLYWNSPSGICAVTKVLQIGQEPIRRFAAIKDAHQ